MTDEEKLYTLEEARKIIQSQLCIKMHGEHDLVQHIQSNYIGIRYLLCVSCSRCDLKFVPRHQEK